MKPPPFDYVVPASVAEAIDALGVEDARVLAGGQSMVPMMNLRLARPSVLVDVNGLDELDFVKSDGSSVRIGALCRHRRLERDELIGAMVPLVAHAMPHIAHPHVRNRGTIGGSLAHADPTAELALVLRVLDGSVTVQGASGSRDIGAADLFVGAFSTSIAEGELLTEVRLPGAGVREGFAFEEFAVRYGDFAIVSAAVALGVDDNGRCVWIRGGANGIAGTPIDLSPVLAGAIGEPDLSQALVSDLAAAVAAAIDPVSDVHASSEYRRELTQLLVVKALRNAFVRATGGR